MARYDDISSYPLGEVGKLKDSQVDYGGEWARVPDWNNTPLASMHKAQMQRVGKTTVTEVNPLDIGSPETEGWGDVPHSEGTVVAARRMK